MGTNELGQKTVAVVVNKGTDGKVRRLFYHTRMLVSGERFECEEVQAQKLAATGAVSLVVERPKISKPTDPPPPRVDPIVATVLAAEAPAPVVEPAAAEPPAAVAAPQAPVAEPVAGQQTPAAPKGPPPFPERYARRDLRSKP